MTPPGAGRKLLREAIADVDDLVDDLERNLRELERLDATVGPETIAVVRDALRTAKQQRVGLRRALLARPGDEHGARQDKAE